MFNKLRSADPEVTKSAKENLLSIANCFASHEDVAEFVGISRSTMHSIINRNVCTIGTAQKISGALAKLSSGIYEKAKAKAKNGKLRYYHIMFCDR